MRKWSMPLIVMLAIGCARSSATAQPPEAPQASVQQTEPAPPAPPPQPSDREARAAQEAERAAAQADRQRAREEAAVARAQAAEARAQVRAAMQVKKEKAAWIGVVTDRMPAALRQHLQMKHRGIGLIVERVEPKSPADEAGLMQYDILEKIDDQWLVNSEQFGVLIRMHQPGEEISLSVIRQGQPMQIKIKLGEKELPVLGMGGGVWIGEAPMAGVYHLGNGDGLKVFTRDLELDPGKFKFKFDVATEDGSPATAPGAK